MVMVVVMVDANGWIVMVGDASNGGQKEDISRVHGCDYGIFHLLIPRLRSSGGRAFVRQAKGPGFDSQSIITI
ncbi:hypothetical protein M0802_009881 [Mischocyttarus mexicanus]|nr:hypothetical protein M0802_009881 [Mischocyttarus mexicanus]